MARIWRTAPFFLAMLLSAGRAEAQAFDPRGPLLQLIQAFQNCGPPQVYQMLSPQLFQIIAAQTGGMGCYANIRAAGPVLNMQVMDKRDFPVGPVYSIRVTHQTGPVDWFIGYNLALGRVEFLTFQAVAAQAPAPTVLQGPTNPTGGSTNPGGSTPPPAARPKPAPGPRKPPPTGSQSDGCNLYPDMCK